MTDVVGVGAVATSGDVLLALDGQSVERGSWKGWCQ